MADVKVSPVQTIRPDVLKEMAAAGALEKVTLIGNGSGFRVAITVKTEARILATFRGNIRNFKNISTAFGYLTEMGITKFEVEAGNEIGLPTAKRG